MQVTKQPAKKDLDAILREAAGGYGDLLAAAIDHDVSLAALQSRLKELQKNKSALKARSSRRVN
ncbi:MAG: hypothetical protein GKC10_05230 [Methanosarcinales archaeon]|nr:hypothetical protein [Methanosarcinales archaeon]